MPYRWHEGAREGRISPRSALSRRQAPECTGAFGSTELPIRLRRWDRVILMDSGWAIVVGACIALVGSIGAPWLREWASHRADEKRARQDDLRGYIVELIERLTDVLIAIRNGKPTGFAKAAAATTGTKIALLLTRHETAIERMIATTINQLSKEDPGKYISALQSQLHRWYRGEVTADDALLSFRTTLTEDGLLTTKQ